MEKLEKEAVEENEQKKRKLIVASPNWLDLPEPTVTNIILEHLEVDDYIRFSAVCKGWQLIQKEHGISYSPYPPPSPLTLPWLTCNRRFYTQKYIRFYLPLKQKWYNVPLFKTVEFFYTIDCGKGWLLLNHPQWSWHIFNPITGVQIELPPLSSIAFYWSSIVTARISSQPADPDCTIAIRVHKNKFYLYRLNDNRSLKKFDYSDRKAGKMVFFRNKIYNVMRNEIGIIDTLLPNSVEHMIHMDCSYISSDLLLKRFDVLDFQGELVMVIIECDKADVNPDDYSEAVVYDRIKEFHVFRADFSENKWERLISLGDHALFFSLDKIFSLPADDVGYKKNTVYSTVGSISRGVGWSAFDLTTRDWIHGGPPMLLPKDHWSWFVPTLGYSNVSKGSTLE